MSLPLVVAITGASGVIYGVEILRALRKLKIPTHLIVSEAAARTLLLETDIPLAEVRALRKRGYGPELRPLQGIGYRHMHPVVDGSDTLVNALEGMKRDTRRFARRQRTWLRAVAGVRWFDPAEEKELTSAVDRFLADGEPLTKKG